MNEIRLPYDYIPSPTAGSPIASGYIYIGTAGTDPTIVENQLSVSARQEDGTEVVISQPIRTNAGGNPVLSGSPITLLVSANEFSITVQNSIGAQVYTQSNATTAIPASGAGDASITTSTGTQTIQEAIDTRLFVGAAEPSFTVPYMKWADTTSGLLKLRNAADNAWINLFSLSTGIADYLATGNYYTDSGAADAYVLSTVGTIPAPSAYSDGMVMRFIPDNSNTGAAATINAAGLGDKSLVDLDGSALGSGRLAAGEEAVAVYNAAGDHVRVVSINYDTINDAISAISLGVDQTWQNLSASRSAGVTYTNSTGKPIALSVRCVAATGTQSATLTIGGEPLALLANTNASGVQVALFGIVPDGGTYSVALAGGASINRWSELRV